MKKKILVFEFILIMLLAVSTGLNAESAGDALHFDGTNDYVEVPSSSNLNFGESDFTISLWIKSSLTSDGTLVGKMWDARSSTGGNGWAIQLLASGRFRFYIADTPSGQPINRNSTSGNVYNDGEWHHLCLTVDRDANVSFYVNGKLDNAVSLDGETGNLSNDYPLLIGIDYNKGGNDEFPFSGLIDEVRIWNDVRTITEIRANMCKTLIGNESGLVAYYKMTDCSGISLADNSTNSNSGTLQNMDNSDWVTSGAALGDASTYNYTSPSSINLASANGDDVTVGTISGSPDGVQIYRVDSEPNVTIPPAGLNQLSQEYYFGVFVVGGTTPTYTLTYDYDGHPGISNENNLELASRSNNSATSWTDLNATLNVGAHTLIKTDQSGTEYILASTSDNALPVTLSSFTAEYSNGYPTLSWTTQTEENNAYWNVYRSISQNFGQVSWLNVDEIIEGAGTVTEPTNYIYTDVSNVVENTTYYYWIECVDNGGETDNYGYVALFVPEGVINQGIPAVPDDYGLQQNYPNPFNPSTSISFAIAEDGYVELMIYNVKGNKIKTIFYDHIYADQTNTAIWDGKDANGNQVSSGVYFYKLNTGTREYSKKMIIVK